MTTADRLAEIQARANAATDGPWEHNGVNGVYTPDGSCVAITYRHQDQRRWEDAEFIAAAREDVPWLLDLARKQQAALDAILRLADDYALVSAEDILSEIEEALR